MRCLRHPPERLILAQSSIIICGYTFLYDTEVLSSSASCVRHTHGGTSYLVRSVRMGLTPVPKVRKRFGKLEQRLLLLSQQLL